MELGIHTSFKKMRPKGIAGSNPVSGTNKEGLNRMPNKTEFITIEDKTKTFPNPFLYQEATTHPFLLTPEMGEKIIEKAKAIVEMLTVKVGGKCK